MPHPPRSVLGDSGMLRVVGVLFLNAERSFTLGDLQKRLPKMNRATLIRTLRDAVVQGLADKSEESPPRYRANAKHHLAPELRSIAVKTFGGAEALTARIIASPEVAFAAIYGSFAAGTAGPTSDIDLVLVVTDVREPGFADLVSDLAEAGRALGREINPTIYDVAEFKTAKTGSKFLVGVLNGPLMILKGD